MEISNKDLRAQEFAHEQDKNINEPLRSSLIPVIRVCLKQASSDREMGANLLPGDNWQCLEKFWEVTADDYYQHLRVKARDAAKYPKKEQMALSPPKTIIWPKEPLVPRFKKPQSKDFQCWRPPPFLRSLPLHNPLLSSRPTKRWVLRGIKETTPEEFSSVPRAVNQRQPFHFLHPKASLSMCV